MLMFYGIAGGLLVVALLYWFIAVRRQGNSDQREQLALAQEQLNIYRLRLRELEYEKEQDYLDDKEYQASVNQLKRQLLHDLSLQNQALGHDDQSKRPGIFALAGALFLVFFVVAFYYTTGESAKIRSWQETVALLPELGKRAVMNEGEMLSAKELQQFALGLRTKLFHDDTDAVAWLLLGRVTMTLNDLEASALAFERAYKLDPNKMATLLSYAQVLLMMGDQGSVHKAAGLLSVVLQQDPNNSDALLMSAYVAEQMGQMDQAMSTWRMLLAVLAPDDQRRAFVEDKLQQMQGMPADANHGGAQAASSEPPTADTNSATMASVTVHLSLDDKLVGKIPAGATLFVYAKAAAGRPMPAAVIKLSEFSFPMTLQLSDANAMLADYKLSTLDQIVVWCRISKDSNIGISAGELQGQSGVFSLDKTQEVTVVVDQIL